MTRFNIFYSWQSDLPSEIARDLIRKELKNAAHRLEGDFPNTDFVMDEATRDVPGSPNIPLTILKKIQMSDVFVCDLNPVARTRSGKAVANPNVLIELGYATAKLGWNRIVLLLNETHANVPDDIPFDVNKHRMSKYKVADASDNNGRGQLKKMLTDAIRLIYETNPCYPNESPALSREQIERNRDLRELVSLLEVMPITLLENGANELPAKFETDLNVCRLVFEATTSSALFHLSKPETMQIIQHLGQTWQKIDSYTNDFFSNSWGVPRFNITSERADHRQHQRDRNAYDRLAADRDAFLSALHGLAEHVRKRYPEIDLRETSQAALVSLNSLIPEDWVTTLENVGSSSKKSEDDS